ncbi:multidrug ABC transporter ATP-binding protein [Paraclostridium benzoelyticum]|nr:multidrug ABC transporter ATP-binding protein [Paraclostridium benzoelyticum]
MNSYKQLSFLFPFLKKSKGYLTIGIIGMIASSLIIAPIPYLIGYTIDTIVLVDKSYTNLVKMIAALALIHIFRYVLTLVYQYYFTKLQQNVINEIRLSMISNIIDAPLSFINKKEKGYILGRIAESQQIGALFSPTILSSLIGIFDLFFSLFMMITLNVKLTVIALIIIPIYFIISKKSSKKISESTRKVTEASAILNGDVYEMLNGLEHIKLLNGKDIQIKKLSIKLKAMMKSVMKQNLNFIFFVQNIILTNEIATLLVLGFSGVLILNNEITIGIYTSFSIYISRILSVTQSIGSLEITIKPICITIERVKEFFNLENESSLNSEVLNENIDCISFNNVSFKYNESSDFIINNFNDNLKVGDKVLIKGINGSGKTTLTKLITGLYMPTSGIVFANGKDYSKLNKKSIRDKIGIVSQDIFLFKGTILENILYGQTTKTKEDVINLISNLGLVDYIDRLCNGLDTNIIENGSSVSGGQAQMIAFLRAIIGDKDLIILDEATSNLDIETRKHILKILEEKDLGKILIIISHQDEELNFVNKEINLVNNNKAIAN